MGEGVEGTGIGCVEADSVSEGHVVERWASVAGFSDYEVSTIGNIRRVAFTGKVYKNCKRISKPDAKGYLLTSLQVGNTWVRRRIHRLMLESFVGPRPEGCVTAHWNGIPSDNRLENLRWATAKENTLDGFRHGTLPSRGSKNGHSKLTDEIVCELRLRYASGGITQKLLAIEFGVSRSIVSRAISGATWKHV